MRNPTRVNAVLLFLLAVLLIPMVAEGSLSISCICTDDDGDGYGNPASTYCTNEGLDCVDNPVGDDPVCATDTCLSCGPLECAPCAKCINPGATEICDGIDNNCDDAIDEEPAASESCDNGLFCDGEETCDAGSCQPGTAPCADDGNDCTDDNCNEAGQSCEYPCNATGYEDPCCEDEACLGNPACTEPVCGNGVIEPPGEQCDPPTPFPEESDQCNPGEYCTQGCICSLVAIELSYFDATGRDLAVEITWGTESETDNAGFNILRSDAEDGVYAQINGVLILAQGTPSSGWDYTYTDSDVVNGTTYWYKLEDVDIQAVSTFHGPVSATPQASAGLWDTASSAQASAIGNPGSESLNYFYLFTLPLLFIGVRLGILAYRRKR